MKLDDFTKGYIEAMFFCGFDEDVDKELLTIDNIADKTMNKIIEECKDFQKHNSVLLNQIKNMGDYKNAVVHTNEEMAGHDFWLTRNGHGAGFWDRNIGEIGESLTASSDMFGTCEPYIADDNKIYI